MLLLPRNIYYRGFSFGHVCLGSKLFELDAEYCLKGQPRLSLPFCQPKEGHGFQGAFSIMHQRCCQGWRAIDKITVKAFVICHGFEDVSLHTQEVCSPPSCEPCFRSSRLACWLSECSRNWGIDPGSCVGQCGDTQSFLAPTYKDKENMLPGPLRYTWKPDLGAIASVPGIRPPAVSWSDVSEFGNVP